MDGEVTVGMPSGMFLPLGSYKLKYLTDLASLTLPIRGPFPAESGIEGEYDICPQPGAIVFLTLTQAMIASGKYPNLTGNQRFVLAGIELDGDNLTVVGRVVELLEE